MKAVSDTAPIDFHSLPENEQKEVDRVVGKIIAGCTIKTSGKDLLREVYLSGLYHGVNISKTVTQ